MNARTGLRTWMAAAWALLATLPALAGPGDWAGDWPRTDFTRATVPLTEILSGGPPRDGIPPIEHPRFVSLAEASALDDREPAVVLVLEGEARAYPLRVLIWHEIVNDRFAGRPVAVTYCPLCNAAIVFDAVLEGQALDFGTTGKLRHSDLVMYDRQTESWWQQYTGEAIVGALAGRRLAMLPSRLDSLGRFRERHPQGRVLVPNDPAFRDYGANPYMGYEDSGWPFLYKGEPPTGITPLERVVVVGAEAWTVDLVKVRGRIEAGPLVLEWHPGQASALTDGEIAAGREVGSITVRRREGEALVDIVHHVTFAFVLHTFRRDATLHTLWGPVTWRH